MARKKSGNRIIWIFLIGIIVLLVVAVAMKNAGLIGKPKLTQVTIDEVKSETIIEVVTASGAIQPVSEISLSPEVSGEIIELKVLEGEEVSKGDLLVRINPEIFVQRVNQSEALLNQAKANAASARAGLARARANFERQKLDYDRQQKLFGEKVISQADWETAQANYKVGEQDLAAAEENARASEFNVQNAFASLQDAKENLSRTSIYAPYTGTVSKLNVEQGERMVGTSQMAGTEMMRIANLFDMEVRVNVNENDIIRVHLGDTAIIDVDAYSPMDKLFKGVVTSIANTANDRVSADAVTEFQVKIRILNSSYQDLMDENPDRSPFRPGMTASVDIQTKRKENVLSVPLAAVTTRTKSVVERAQRDATGTEEEDNKEEEKDEDEIECVFLLDENSQAQLVEVKTGVKDFDNIEIISGITAGQKIISGPYLEVSRRLKDGDKVEDSDKKESEPEESADSDE